MLCDAATPQPDPVVNESRPIYEMVIETIRAADVPTRVGVNRKRLLNAATHYAWRILKI